MLELDGKIDHYNSIVVKYIPKVIDYDSFIKVIKSDSLCYIPASKWKHMVNKIDLIIICIHYSGHVSTGISTIMLLIKHGSIYSPYDFPLLNII